LETEPTAKIIRKKKHDTTLEMLQLKVKTSLRLLCIYTFVLIYLVVQNDSRRKQNVDKQVEISEEKRFVNHFGRKERRSS